MRLTQRLRPRINRFLDEHFELWERMGWHLVPNSYDGPVPSVAELRRGGWPRPSELPGVAIDDGSQLELLDLFAREFAHEYSTFPLVASASDTEYFVDNQSFGSVDGEVLYCMVRHLKPSRIIEIGSGWSTLLAIRALLRNRDEGAPGQLTAIEPHPNDVLARGLVGLDRLLVQPVQEVPLHEFEKLGPNDILFIDSSHVLSMGGDVQFEYLEILPRLRAGVVIHAHDIFLPEDYPREWVLDLHRFWTEQYLLQAFLAFNDSFSVLWASRLMSLRHPERLATAFPSFRPGRTRPASLWMRRTR